MMPASQLVPTHSGEGCRRWAACPDTVVGPNNQTRPGGVRSNSSVFFGAAGGSSPQRWKFDVPCTSAACAGNVRRIAAAVFGASPLTAGGSRAARGGQEEATGGAGLPAPAAASPRRRNCPRFT